MQLTCLNLKSWKNVVSDWLKLQSQTSCCHNVMELWLLNRSCLGCTWAPWHLAGPPPEVTLLDWNVRHCVCQAWVLDSVHRRYQQLVNTKQKQEIQIVSQSRYTQLIRLCFLRHTIASLRQVGMMSLTPPAKNWNTITSTSLTSFEMVHTHTHEWAIALCMVTLVVLRWLMDRFDWIFSGNFCWVFLNPEATSLAPHPSVCMALSP